MPNWVDKDFVKKQVCIKRRSSGKLVNEKNTHAKAQRMMRKARYDRAHKLATDMLWQIKQDGLAGKRGNGVETVCERINFLYLSEPGDRKLTRGAIREATGKRKEYGKTPPKRGRRPKITKLVTDQVAMQAAMMQASGEGEATTAKLSRALFAATTGTEHEGISIISMPWRRHDVNIQPSFSPYVQAKNDDDRRVEWLTYKNINDWTYAVKGELINLGIVFDKPGLISECRLICIVFISILSNLNQPPLLLS